MWHGGLSLPVWMRALPGAVVSGGCLPQSPPAPHGPSSRFLSTPSVLPAASGVSTPTEHGRLLTCSSAPSPHQTLGGGGGREPPGGWGWNRPGGWARRGPSGKGPGALNSAVSCGVSTRFVPPPPLDPRVGPSAHIHAQTRSARVGGLQAAQGKEVSCWHITSPLLHPKTLPLSEGRPSHQLMGLGSRASVRSQETRA